MLWIFPSFRPSRSRRRRTGAVLILCFATLALGACALPFRAPASAASTSLDSDDPPPESSAETAQDEDLVIVSFSLEDEFGPEGLLDAMWPVEERALNAIEESGLGYLDGNEIGANEYSLFFYGADREAMWKLLEPIMAAAPLPLDRAELWPPGEDATPRIVRGG